MQTQTLRCLVLATLAAALLLAQTELDRPDPLIAAIQDSSSFALDMLAKAADQICEEDYAVEPTAAGCKCSLATARRMIEFIIRIAISDR